MKILFGGLLTLLLALTGCAPNRAKNNEDMALITGDYKTVFAQYQAEAAKGDSAAERKLGYMYTDGKGVPADPVEGLRWYEKVADAGDASAIIQVSNYYVLPHDGRVDYAQAFKWCKAAVDVGDSYCWLWLSVYYENGLGVSRDHGQALYWFDKFKTTVKVASGGAGHKDSDADESTAFIEAVRLAVLSLGFHTPSGARSASGVVDVYLTDMDGRPINVSMAKSSGDPVVDAAVVDFLQKGYLPPLPPSLQKFDHFLIAFQYGDQQGH